MNIPYIPPIKLLRGSHSDTGSTGQGCGLNVISYLNNEPVITDDPECVCYVLRPLFRWFNDFLTDADRPELLPYILPAMGSTTTNQIEINRRLNLVVKFACVRADSASADSAKASAMWASKSAESAASAAKASAKWAASAMWASKSEVIYRTHYMKTKSDFFALLDEYLPHADIEISLSTQQQLERLYELAQQG